MEHYGEPEKSKVTCLQRLVEELMRTKPRSDLLKRDMEHLGLPFSKDPVECINTVLKALHPIE